MIEIQRILPSRDAIRLNEDRQTSTQLVSRNNLCRRLERGPEARAKFVESHLNKGIAYQLRAMRESRSWSQQQLAAEVGMPQTAISRLESSTYGKPTITTLKRMARVYDVALEVKFVPFSKFVNKISGTPYVEYGLSSDALEVPSFDEEREQGVVAPATPPARISLLEITNPPQAEGLRNAMSPYRLASQAEPEKKQPSSEKNARNIMEGGLANAAGVGATG